jgi:outer membrane receptor protein involved in Fe transport
METLSAIDSICDPDRGRLRMALKGCVAGGRRSDGDAPSAPLVSVVLLLTTLLLVPFVATSASAQEATEVTGSSDPWAGVEVMLVTGGEGRAELLTGTASVTAFDADTLESLGVQNISDISDYTPNLEVVVAGTTSPTLFIRGVGLNDFSPVATGAISVYQDDVPRGSSAILLGRIFDVEEVVVLRGPQGTGPYRNASAGAIKIYPRQPTGVFNASLSTSYGNYDYVDVEGALEVPLIPEFLSMRTAFGFTKRGGWMKNRCSGIESLDARPPRTGTGNDNEEPHSMCGEGVTFQGDRKSNVPAGLPSHVNDLSNWAIRSIFRFTPDLSIDTSWSLNLHYSKVRDDSHIGQSIGVQSLQPEVNANIPADITEIVGSGPFNTAGRTSYADQDIIDRLDELLASARAECGILCTPATPRDQRLPASRAANLKARSELGRELEDLDQNPFRGAVNQVGKTRNTNIGFALRGDVDFTDSVKVESITGFERWDRSSHQDLDFTPNTVFHLNNSDRGYQFSQELRVGGALPTDAVIDWEVGGLLVADQVEVFGLTDSNDEISGNEIVRDYEQEVLAISGYVKGSWDFTEVFGLDFGARWNYERKQMDYELYPTAPPISANEDLSFDSPTGNIRLRYAPTEDVSFYVMYNRGWKAGSYNATSNPDKGLTFASPERIDAYEFGWNLNAFEGRVRVTGALFYYDYYNYQIFTSETNLAPAPEFVTINANSAEVYGAELETFFEPFDGTSLRVNFGWLETQFLDFTQFQLRSIRDGQGQQRLFEKAIVHTGNRLLNSPQYSVSIIASQLLDLGRYGAFTFNYNAVWTDDVYFDPTEGAGIPTADGRSVLSDTMIGEKAYWLHGVSLNYTPRDTTLSITGWVRNLTNEAYRNFSADLSTFLGSTIHFIGEPRTYGMTVGVQF